MIKDNSLANRLNAIKEGKEPPTPPKQDGVIPNTLTVPNNSIKEPLSPTANLFATIYGILEIVLLSLVYGYGLKTIFSANWGFFGILCVGIILYDFKNLISRLNLFH
jgi:hypothetical protein